VEAVDILVGIDRVDDRLRVDLLGDRQLAEDTVDLRILVELLDQRQQLGLALLRT
jgi:hypothetical protein